MQYLVLGLAFGGAYYVYRGVYYVYKNQSPTITTLYTVMKVIVMDKFRTCFPRSSTTLNNKSKRFKPRPLSDSDAKL